MTPPSPDWKGRRAPVDLPHGKVFLRAGQIEGGWLIGDRVRPLFTVRQALAGGLFLAALGVGVWWLVLGGPGT